MLGLLLAVMTTSAGRAAEPVRLRVMTYNVHSCKGWDRRIKPERIAAVIADYKPDVVALQEVRVGRVEAEKASDGVTAPPVGEPPLPPPSVVPPRSPSDASAPVPFTDQPRAIAAALGMHSVFYPLVRLAKEDYGIAILSRHPMRLVRAANLPTLPGRKPLERRGAVWVELDLGGRKVQLLDTHLGLNTEERSAQIEDLLGPSWLRSAKFVEPFVVCGDLNSGSGAWPYKRLSEFAHDAAGPSALNTFPSVAPVSRLDYVFVSSGTRVESSSRGLGPRARFASDHLPVVVDLVLP